MRQINKSGFYEYLPHTADVKIKAFGESLEEAFVNCGVGMMNILIDTDEVIAKDRDLKNSRMYVVTARSLLSVLYDFLNQLVYTLEADEKICVRIFDIAVQKTAIDGKPSFSVSWKCLEADAKKYSVPALIKSATYHEMSIEQINGKFVIMFVLDI